MKKIIYFLILLINSFVLGQQYPTIHPLQGGFTFTGEKLETYAIPFGTRASSCGFTFGNTYKYFSFKANFDMVFAFDLIAKKPDFRFIVWKLDKGKLPTAIFDKGGTIDADRAVEGNSNIKGLKEGDINSCESYSTNSPNGYVKAFEGSELLKKDETVVIAVYGGFDTELFDIKVNVAEERQINTFNNLCVGLSYTYNQIFDAIKTDSGLTDIKLYTNNVFNTEINSGTTFSTDTTIYAQVRDASGNLKYIYTIPLKFIPEHQFNFRSDITPIYTCIPYNVINNDFILSKIIPEGEDLRKYSIKSIDGRPRDNNSSYIIEFLRGEGEVEFQVVVSYNGTCVNDSEIVILKMIYSKPFIDNDIEDATCNDTYLTNFSIIYNKLGVDRAHFDLVVTLDGNNVNDGVSVPITSTLNYKIKIKSKSAATCESNEINFIVKKTSNADIKNYSISNICRSDLTKQVIQDAIDSIKNGSSIELRFFTQSGNQIEEVNLEEYMKRVLNGKIIVKAFASNNPGICDTTVELSFNLSQSSFSKVENIETLKSSCSEVGLGYTFSKSEIENYLKTKLNRTDIIFSGINDTSLADNQSGSIRFKVQVNGEACWSEEMILPLQVLTKPNVSEASKELQADCNNLITIDEATLKELFGANSTTDFNYQIQHINSTPLTFDGSGKAFVKVIFKNKLDENCFVEKIITINKSQELVVDTALLESFTKSNEIIYCEDNSNTAKNQIQVILDYIKTQYPNLVAQSTVDEIYSKFNSNKGEVEVIFNDPSFCGNAIVKIYYQKNNLPTISVPENGAVCSGELFVLDFTSQPNYSNYNYSVEKNDGSIIAGIDKFELNVGTYKITIEDRTTNCSIVKTLVIANSELPTIEKITINQGNITIIAKGNGSLEYALFDDKGNIIVNWQAKNTLDVPVGNINNNFTVKVRLNNCGTTEVSDLVYLDLPNFVSPNGDGKNDLWQPMKKNGQATDTKNSYKLIIFDRFGKQILTQEGINIIKWDGTHLGKPVADGTYWYLLEFSKESSILNVQYSGSILVKRKVN